MIPQDRRYVHRPGAAVNALDALFWKSAKPPKTASCFWSAPPVLCL